MKKNNAMSNKSNEQLSALAILSVTIIALAMMTLTAWMNQAQAQTTMSGKQFQSRSKCTYCPQGNLGMGVSVHNGIVGANFEASWLRSGERSGGYIGMDFGSQNRGADDFYTLYFGRAQRIWENGQLRGGISLGAASYGNTVTDLTSWGLGYIVGTDGADYFIGGVDVGVLFKTGHNGSVSTLYSTTTNGPIYRLTFNLSF